MIVPPLEWDPTRLPSSPHDFVEVGPAGTVESWSWVAKPTSQHPLDHPFAFALVKLDGADTAIMHAVDAGSIDAMSTGMRVAPRWKAERIGHITDIDAFVPGETPRDDMTGRGPTEPVTMMEYDASIAYRLPVPTNVASAPKLRQRAGPVPWPALPDLQPHLHRRARVLPDRLASSCYQRPRGRHAPRPAC